MICDAWLMLSGGGASAICPPTVPSSPCQASMKSWLIVSALGSVLAATFTVWPSIPPRSRSIALASASPSIETGQGGAVDQVVVVEIGDVVAGRHR